ncbi:MAG: hypothetical protein ACRD0O_04005, partial [Acidimicrobiia bacterium]
MKTSFDAYCRPCRKAYQHEWYMAHREEALAAAAARREKDKVKRLPKPPTPQRRPRVQVRTTTAKQGNSYVVGLKTVGGNKTQVITK